MIIQSKSKNYGDNLVTPNEIFQKCCNIWGYFSNVDIAASHKNSKCGVYLTKEDNALVSNWDLMNLVSDGKYETVIWFNFPHSMNKLFFKKAYKEWEKHNIRMIGIAPINILCSNYASEFILPFAKYQPLTGRIKFLDPETLEPSKYNSVNGYVTIFYDKRK